MRLRNRGFLIVDAMMALCILGILMALMAVGLTAHERTAQRLANTRAACNAVEGVLANMQTGKPPESRESADHFQIDRLKNGTAVAGCTWVRVTATVGGRSASLIGLVKSISLAGKTK